MRSNLLCLPQMGIANRDIKLENTLLMDLTETPVLKLCDFGYSNDELCASISKTMCGEPICPELKLLLLRACTFLQQQSFVNMKCTVFRITWWGMTCFACRAEWVFHMHRVIQPAQPWYWLISTRADQGTGNSVQSNCNSP